MSLTVEIKASDAKQNKTLNKHATRDMLISFSIFLINNNLILNISITNRVKNEYVTVPSIHKIYQRDGFVTNPRERKVSMLFPYISSLSWSAQSK